MLIRLSLLGATLFAASFSTLADAAYAAEKSILPEDLSLYIFAMGIPKARSLDVSAEGHVAVGTNGRSIFLFEDVSGDAQDFEKFSLSGFENPNGVAWLGKDLFVAGDNPCPCC